eukprot:gene31636-6830_t
MLDEVKPSRDGSLKGYSPSSGFEQTVVKGWVRNGPVDDRMSSRSLVLQLPDHAQLAFLELLQGRALLDSMLVCKSWVRLLKGDPRFTSWLLGAKAELKRQEAEKAELKRQEAERKMQEARMNQAQFYADKAGRQLRQHLRGSYLFFDSDSDYDYWDGYGST